MAKDEKVEAGPGEVIRGVPVQEPDAAPAICQEPTTQGGLTFLTNRAQ